MKSLIMQSLLNTGKVVKYLSYFYFHQLFSLIYVAVKIRKLVFTRLNSLTLEADSN